MDLGLGMDVTVQVASEASAPPPKFSEEEKQAIGGRGTRINIGRREADELQATPNALWSDRFRVMSAIGKIMPQGSWFA